MGTENILEAQRTLKGAHLSFAAPTCTLLLPLRSCMHPHFLPLLLSLPTLSVSVSALWPWWQHPVT
jgi:hypothetical protein